jgi:hypothetical protein
MPRPLLIYDWDIILFYIPQGRPKVDLMCSSRYKSEQRLGEIKNKELSGFFDEQCSDFGVRRGIQVLYNRFETLFAYRMHKNVYSIVFNAMHGQRRSIPIHSF